MAEVTNIVGAGHVGCELSLGELAPDLGRHVDGVDYQHEDQHRIVLRFVHPTKATVLLFRTGSYTLIGTKRVREFNAVAEHFHSLLEEIGVELEPSVVEPATINNMVASGRLTDDFAEGGINLNALTIGLGLELVEYEPEQFPGVVYRSEEVDVVFVIFSNGNFIITGAKDMDTIEKAKSVLTARLREVLEPNI